MKLNEQDTASTSSSLTHIKNNNENTEQKTEKRTNSKNSNYQEVKMVKIDVNNSIKIDKSLREV